MSASLVRQSLAIVDSDFSTKGKKSKKTVVKRLIPESHKIIETVYRKGRKDKVQVLNSRAKLTVTEAKKTCISKEERLKNNLRKLKLIEEACTLDLEEEVTNQIIERAVTKRPVKLKNKKAKNQKTAFTEEDFAKFEAEYFDE